METVFVSASQVVKIASIYQKAAKRISGKEFSVIGIHLEMGFSDMDFTEVRKFIKEHNIEYIDYPTKLYDILQLHPDKKNGNIQCSLCSTLKKGAIVKAAQEYNCNKTAFVPQEYWYGLHPSVCVCL